MIIKHKSKHNLSPKQQKMLDMFRILFIFGFLGLLLSLLILIVGGIDPYGVTYFV